MNRNMNQEQWTEIFGRHPSPGSRLLTRRRLVKLIFVLAALFPLTAAGVPETRAESVAAKNKEGNRLFAQGRYQDAEKAYLGAQLDAPGRPELLYNHGNALIKQKKYDQAIQSLGQSASKGERGLQGNSWYNLGNALFEAGKYKDSAQAYIQALRVNPMDRDAKNNLELAWRKLQEQKQSSSGKNQKEDQKENPESRQSQQQNRDHSGEKDKEQNAPRPQDQKQPPQQQSSPGERKEASISKEQALQILDAMKNQELAEQKKLLERQVKQVRRNKDW